MPGARQEGQEIQCRAVRPVHILDHQPDPAPSTAGRRVQQLRDRREQPLTLPALIPAARARTATGTQPRDQPPDLAPHILRGGTQRLLQHSPAVQPGQLTQRRGQRQQRQRVGQRQAFPPHRHHPRGRSPGHRLPGKPGFPHPRVPHHQHQAHIPGQRGDQARQLTVTTDKRRRRSHTPTPPGLTRPVNPSPPCGHVSAGCTDDRLSRSWLSLAALPSSHSCASIGLPE
jgi:hypothetical protein